MLAIDSLAQATLPPVLGTSGAIVLSGSDQTVALTAGKTLMLVAKTGDAFFAIGGLATTAANQSVLLAGVPMYITLPAGGALPGDGLLHVIQGPATGGTLYYSLVG